MSNHDLFTKITELFKNSQVSDELCSKILQFIRGEDLDDQFLVEVPCVEFFSLQEANKMFLTSVLRQILNHSELDIRIRVIKVFCTMGKTTFLKIIAPFFSYYTHETITKFQEYKISHQLIIAWCAEEMDYRDFRLRKFVINYYDSIYDSSPDDFITILKTLDQRPRLFVLAYLAKNNAKSSELKEELENYLISFSKEFIESAIISGSSDENVFAKYLVQKYLEADNIVTHPMISELLDKLDPSLIEHEDFQFVIGLSYLFIDNSVVAQKFIALFTTIDYNLAISLLAMFLDIDSSEDTIFESLGLIYRALLTAHIDPEIFLAWFASNFMSVDIHKAKEFLMGHKILEPKYINKAVLISSDKGRLYLNCLMTSQHMHDLENTLIQLVLEPFAQEGIPKPLMSLYKLYLQGSIPFKIIRETLKDLEFLASEALYENLESLKAVNMIETSSSFYTRLIRFLCGCKKFSFTAELLGYNLLHDSDKHVDHFLKKIMNKGVTVVDLLPYIIDNAVDAYNTTWKSCLVGLIASTPLVITSELFKLSDIQKVFILSLLYTTDAEKYLPLVIDSMSRYSDYVSESIMEVIIDSNMGFEAISVLLFSRDKKLRLSAIVILSGWNNERSKNALSEALDFEDDAGLIEMIQESLTI